MPGTMEKSKRRKSRKNMHNAPPRKTAGCSPSMSRNGLAVAEWLEARTAADIGAIARLEVK